MLKGIGEKQVVLGGHSGVWGYMSLTMRADHDLVGRAPGARFIRQRLKDHIESGDGLDGLDPAAYITATESILFLLRRFNVRTCDLDFRFDFW
jgi:hypothetical protein